MDPNVDLFGDPIPSNWGMRGRPEHIATDENALKIKVLLAEGWSNGRIAGALGITVPTLRKHYFSILGDRAKMRDRMKAAHLTKVYEKAIGDGDTGALRLLDQMIQRAELRPEQAPKPKPERLGKKQQADQDAKEKVGSWGDVLPPFEDGKPN